MNTEIEAKFCGVDHEAVREKLQSIGATCAQPMRMMRRVTTESSVMKAKNGFLRIRDEGNRVTMTYKQFDSEAVDGAKELEIVVSDFDTTVQIINSIGLDISRQSFQESKRETWVFESVEVVLDEFPWLKPYIEVEGPSADEVARVAKLLGFDMANAVFGDVMAAYRLEYPHLGPKDTIGNVPLVRFGDPLPDLLKA